MACSRTNHDIGYFLNIPYSIYFSIDDDDDEDYDDDDDRILHTISSCLFATWNHLGRYLHMLDTWYLPISSHFRNWIVLHHPGLRWKMRPCWQWKRMPGSGRLKQRHFSGWKNHRKWDETWWNVVIYCFWMFLGPGICYGIFSPKVSYGVSIILRFHWRSAHWIWWKPMRPSCRTLGFLLASA